MDYLTFDDIGLIPSFSDITSRSNVNISTTIHDKKYAFPFVPSNMDTVISPEMCLQLSAHHCMMIYHRFCNLAERLDVVDRFPDVYMSCGVTDEEKTNVITLIEYGCKNFCIDVAHGHTQLVSDMIMFIRSRCKDASIIAGNVCTAEGYRYLAQSGANIIKVGVGPGSACTTRMKTGFGVPQFTAVQECAKAKKELNIETWMIADGGIKHPRDACIALAAGADMVMMGKIFAKTRESAGEKMIKRGDKYIKVDPTEYKEEKIYTHYRGQASRQFMDSYYGDKKKHITPEGEDFYIECVETTKHVLDEYGGSLRTAFTYAGAKDLCQFQKNAKFFRASTNYMIESNTRKE